MYHRFHAPHDCLLETVAYHPGELWNVNPVALRRIDKLFCRNERAVLRMRLTPRGPPIALVPVAAILVAGIRLHCLDRVLDSGERQPAAFTCGATFHKGEEMGWFQHGSTILVFAPDGFSLCPWVEEGAIVRMGQPLMRLPQHQSFGKALG
jgi:phosphatidylserine decarboxylase